MGMGALIQLIAKGRPSPITSALQGFQSGAQMMPNIKMSQLAPLLRQAKIQLAQAQAQKALQQAQSPFGGQSLTGPAGMAQSDINFGQRYGADKTKMAVLNYYKDFQRKSQNIRTFQTLPADERSSWFAKARTLHYTPGQAAQYFSEGFNLGDLERWAQAGHKPPTVADNAENFNNSKLPAAINEVKNNLRPMHPNEIKGTYPLQKEAATAQQKATTATAGMDYLSKAVTNGLNYGGLLSKTIRPWFWDSRSKDPTKQEKAVDYYASHSLKPELALYRVRIQQGQASARIVRELTPYIIGRVKTDLSYLSPDIQKRVQNKVRDVLNGATAASSEQALGPHPTTYIPPKEQPTQQDSTNKIRVRSPDGKVGSIPKEDLQEAMKQGFKRI